MEPRVRHDAKNNKRSKCLVPVATAQQQHSMGSEAGYSLKATDAPRAVVGRGSMHMEANYGEAFPTGWVWAQVRPTVMIMMFSH